MLAAQSGAGRGAASARPRGPCDIDASADDPCVAAHCTTRALYAAYNRPPYQVLRQSDGKTLDIVVVQPRTDVDAGGYADAAAQDAFCASLTPGAARRIQRSREGRLHRDVTPAATAS